MRQNVVKLLLWLKKIIKIFKVLLNVRFVKEYEKGQVKVKNHDHIIGEYRGSVHQDCNLNFNRSIKITVMFHNLENYDSHLIF